MTFHPSTFLFSFFVCFLTGLLLNYVIRFLHVHILLYVRTRSRHDNNTYICIGGELTFSHYDDRGIFFIYE